MTLFPQCNKCFVFGPHNVARTIKLTLTFVLRSPQSIRCVSRDTCFLFHFNSLSQIIVKGQIVGKLGYIAIGDFYITPVECRREPSESIRGKRIALNLLLISTTHYIPTLD